MAARGRSESSAASTFQTPKAPAARQPCPGRLRDPSERLLRFDGRRVECRISRRPELVLLVPRLSSPVPISHSRAVISRHGPPFNKSLTVIPLLPELNLVSNAN